MKRNNLRFILPNLFTVSSIFCGIYAIVQGTEATGADRFYLAAVAILFGILFDAADGRVARMTKSESAFGVQLDSLADVITFGAAPAILAYKWALASFGFVGLVAAFVYATCGALRLARFNVLAATHQGTPQHFVGLPIPLAAGGISSLVLLHHHFGGGTLVNEPLIVVVVLLLSVLMVSRVRYRTFKKVKANGRALMMLLGALGLVLVASFFAGFSVMLTAVWAGFVAFGLAEEIWRFARRLLARTRREKS